MAKEIKRSLETVLPLDGIIETSTKLDIVKPQYDDVFSTSTSNSVEQ